MSGHLSDDPAETRAEVARRRLAQLNASFHGSVDTSAPRVEPEPAEATHRAVVGRRPAVRPVHLRLVATVAVAAGVVLVWWLLAARPEVADVGEAVDLASRGDTVPAGPDDADPGGGGPAVDDEPSEVIVDVAGKVERPGIVALPAGSRVHDAIEAAGGLAGDVDTTPLNLARVLTDGEQVLVGVEPALAAPSGGGGPGGGGAAGAQVNLNTATQEELDTLPGVGPVTAESIIAWRTENGRFSSVEDLLEVSGIGEKTLAELRDRVTV